MNKDIAAKLSAVVLFSIFLHILYHIALLSDILSNYFIGVFEFEFAYKINKIGWVSSDIILCATGYYCMQVFMSQESGLKKWFTITIKHFAWIIPSYYLILFLYLTYGITLQQSLGNSFEFNQSYLAPLLLFYSNFNFARGPWSGVALEGAFLLSMLVQLFVFWGAFISLFGRTTLIPWIIGGLWIVAASLRFFYDQEWHWFSYFNTFTRLDGFLAGVILAYLKSDNVWDRLLCKHKNILLLTSVLAFMVGALLTGGMNVAHPYTNYVAFTSLAIFAFGLLNWILEYPGHFSASFIRLNKLVFAIYLMKLPIIYMSLALVRILWGENSELFQNVTFVIMSLLGCLLFGMSWSFGEKSIRRLLWKKATVLEQHP